MITSNAPTVGEALEEAGVNIGSTDLVEPNLKTEIPVGFFNVNVYRSRPVVVVDGAQMVTVHTASQSPRLIAEAAGFKVYPEDLFNMHTISNVTSLGVVGQTVVIDRAQEVVIASDGLKTIARTHQKTVGAFLDERDVALGPKDTIEPSRETPLTPNMVVKINRVKVVVLAQTEVIPREVKSIKDANLMVGSTKVQAEGSDGQKVSTYRVNFQNGVEQHRELLSAQIAKAPVTKVVLVGTKIDYSANPVELGKQMAAQRGWTGSEWTALYQLWVKESNWNPNARNVWSGACGIPQAYPCSKIVDKSTAGQIQWGLNYIDGKYGSPSNAWATWQRTHSY